MVKMDAKEKAIRFLGVWVTEWETKNIYLRKEGNKSILQEKPRNPDVTEGDKSRNYGSKDKHWDNKGQNKENHLAKKKAILDLHANKNMREDGEGKENKSTVPDFIESNISSLM
ncbi:12748_t:CDS:2, partial [Gigaspora rosea]